MIFLVQNNLLYVPFQSSGVFLSVPRTPPPPSIPNVVHFVKSYWYMKRLK